MDPTEDQLLEAAAPPQPAVRKLSRLRKAGSTPKTVPPSSPFDQNAEPNEKGAQLPTPAASPSSSRPPKEEAAEQPGSHAGSDDEGERETGAVVSGGEGLLPLGLSLPSAVLISRPWLQAGEGYRDEEDELEEYFEKGSEHGDGAHSHAVSDGTPDCDCQASCSKHLCKGWLVLKHLKYCFRHRMHVGAPSGPPTIFFVG